MSKKIIKITEDAERKAVSRIMNEAFYPEMEKILAVKSYLDANFSKDSAIDIDADGDTKLYNTVNKLINNQPVQPMKMEELLRHLDDKFESMISDKADRRKFLIQVIKHWYNNDIDRNGMLTVNFFK